MLTSDASSTPEDVSTPVTTVEGRRECHAGIDGDPVAGLGSEHHDAVEGARRRLGDVHLPVDDHLDDWGTRTGCTGHLDHIDRVLTVADAGHWGDDQDRADDAHGAGVDRWRRSDRD